MNERLRPPLPSVLLIGPRGAGKSTVGRLLSKAWRCEFVDSDDALAKVQGVPHAGYWLRDQGIERFRIDERRCVASLIDGLSNATHRRAVALGGGSVLDLATQADLRRAVEAAAARVVLLTASVSVRVARIAAAPSSTPRPALTGLPLIDETVAVDCLRTPLYERLACLRLDAGAGESAEETCRRLVAALR